MCFLVSRAAPGRFYGSFFALLKNAYPRNDNKMGKEELAHKQEEVDNFHNVCINNSFHPTKIFFSPCSCFVLKFGVFLATQSLNKDFCVN